MNGPAKHISQTLTAPTLFANLMSLVYPMLVNTFAEAKDHHAPSPSCPGPGLWTQTRDPKMFLFIYSKLDFVLKCMLCISVKRKINDQLHLETWLK